MGKNLTLVFLLVMVFATSVSADSSSFTLEEANKFYTKLHRLKKGNSLIAQLDVLEKLSLQYKSNVAATDALMQYLATVYSFFRSACKGAECRW